MADFSIKTENGKKVFEYNGVKIEADEATSDNSVFFEDGVFNLKDIEGDVSVFGSENDDIFNFYNCKNVTGDLADGNDTVTFTNSKVDVKNAESTKEEKAGSQSSDSASSSSSSSSGTSSLPPGVSTGPDGLPQEEKTAQDQLMELQEQKRQLQKEKQKYKKALQGTDVPEKQKAKFKDKIKEIDKALRSIGQEILNIQTQSSGGYADDLINEGMSNMLGAYGVTTRADGVAYDASGLSGTSSSSGGGALQSVVLTDKNMTQGDFNFTENITDSYAGDIKDFQAKYAANKERYEAVAEKTNIPAELIAAIHYRESGCNFDTYLQNGDPLGQPTTHVPAGIYCETWEESAIMAMSDKYYQTDAPLTANSTDIDAYLKFAERYNGLGYKNKGLSSPYVWAGTTNYTKGKYVADGKFDANYVDQRAGVAVLLKSIMV